MGIFELEMVWMEQIWSEVGLEKLVLVRDGVKFIGSWQALFTSSSWAKSVRDVGWVVRASF